MSISPFLFLRLPVKVVGSLFEKWAIGILVLLEHIFECFSICSREEFRENLQIFIRLYLGLLGDISPDDGYLMELTHLSRNHGSFSCSSTSLESSEESPLTITYNSLYDPSFLFEFLDSSSIVMD
jgi:hypothetical protein